MNNKEIEIRECRSVGDLSQCVALQKEVFALPDIEISPVRHFIVSRQAGGFTLGAFAGELLVGFVLSVPSFFGNERFFYSHMAAVKKGFQGSGIGAQLKWAQREKSLKLGVKYIKWTFQPVQSRNAFFNLEKLGVTIKHYEPNFYGTDYSTSGDQSKNIGLDSDRLFAEWHLESEKVEKLLKGESYTENGAVVRRIELRYDWNELVKSDAHKAVAEQERIKKEFQTAFADGLICRGFERGSNISAYLLY
jgi:predicted GNAT superfamily acetyltransferase